MFTRRTLLGSTAPTASRMFVEMLRASVPHRAVAQDNEQLSEILVVTNSTSDTISRFDSATGEVAQFQVGFAPWGIASLDARTAWITTTEGLAKFDLEMWRLLERFPYRTPVDGLTTGEYRPGGMGVAIAPDGAVVYAAVYRTSGVSVVEAFDAATGEVVAAWEVGVRPFQLLVAPSTGVLYSIDHDSFAVTVIDPATSTTHALPAAPLGTEGFDKPHYAAFDDDEQLILPYQGAVVQRLDPATGESDLLPSAANSHQHGIVRVPGTTRYAVVGTGAAGRATGGPNLTLFDVATGEEQVIPLELPHEDVAVTADGRRAWLSGGYSFQNQGWDGVTRVDLETLEVSSFAVPDRPLGILLLEA